MSDTKGKARPVVLTCEEGPCAGKGKIATVDVWVRVRERRDHPHGPLDESSVIVTLTSMDTTKSLTPDRSFADTINGEFYAEFRAVQQGWWRALAVRKDAKGLPEASAARNVHVVAIRDPKDSDHPKQQVTLTLSKQGVAVFVVLDDIEEKPLKGAVLRVRHPDGEEREHPVPPSGEVRLPGAEEDVFTLVSIVHPTHSQIARSHSSTTTSG
jgi:hypothetical protein